MKIIKTKPYFIKLVHDEEEFIKLQTELFENGYSWMNGSVIWIDNNFIKYPTYVSNLPLLGSENKFNYLRETYNKCNNDVLFVDWDINSFDIKLLRSEKLKNISQI